MKVIREVTQEIRNMMATHNMKPRRLSHTL
jgi:hypothetical protein